MCGIAGAFIYDPKAARLDGMQAAIEASVARGEDSFGVVRWSPSTGFRRYGVQGPVRNGWLEAVGQPEPDELTVFLHTSRAEPTTEWQPVKTDSDIPPFVVDGVAVAHNGIIANDEELATAYGISRVSTIDTAVVPTLVARVGVWPAMAKLKGGAALAIFDSASAQMVLCRNFLPLALTWEPGIVCFASEAGFFPDATDPFRQYMLWELPPFSGIELSDRGYRGPFKWGEGPEASHGQAWLPYPDLIRGH